MTNPESDHYFSVATGFFHVVADTGDVKIEARHEWPDEGVYELAISAQCVGAALQSATPSQVLRVQVGKSQDEKIWNTIIKNAII